MKIELKPEALNAIVGLLKLKPDFTISLKDI
jgi:hypothetical protein